MEGLKDFLISLVKVIIPCAIIALVAFIIVKLQPEPVPEPVPEEPVSLPEEPASSSEEPENALSRLSYADPE